MQIEITGKISADPRDRILAIEAVTKAICQETGQDPAEGVMMLLTAAVHLSNTYSRFPVSKTATALAGALGHAILAADGFFKLRRVEEPAPPPQPNLMGRWLPIAQADKTITDVQEFAEVGMTIKTSDRYWVRDEDGRVYESAWSEGKYGRDFWWDFEAESPVDPVEFMPHPLDPRFGATTEGLDNG